MQRLIWVLWPSFIVAGISEALFFVVIDPQELYLFGELTTFSSIATYTIGFFAFWAICACSSFFTCWIQRSAEEINRCPIGPVQRPVGCPKREELEGN